MPGSAAGASGGADENAGSAWFIDFSRPGIGHFLRKLSGGQPKRTASSSNLGNHASEISRAEISYLKLSGSRQSSNPASVSACGYIKKPMDPLFVPAKVTS